MSEQLTLDRKVAKSGSKHDLRGGNKDGYFRKPVGVAAKEITDLFTFKQGRPESDEFTIIFFLLLFTLVNLHPFNVER